jgi:putative membrane protein
VKNAAGLFLKGVAMGAANVIPGVSGGTIAFISGIYERLIKALKSFDLSLLPLLMQGRFSQIAEKTDLKFLTILFSGIAVSIFSLARLLEYTLQFYEVFTLAFFFGLIVASTLGVGRQISKFSLGILIAFLIGFIMAISIAFLTPAAANNHWLYVILCGMVAMSSMILPGLSGSYILLLMGNYVLMLQSISHFHFKFLIPFALGCLLGLVIFSRLLSYLFDHFKEATISLLTGFVAGSLLIIWPWKTTNYITIEARQKAVGYDWYFPNFDADLLIGTVLMLLGFVVVSGIERLGVKG